MLMFVLFIDLFRFPSSISEKSQRSLIQFYVINSYRAEDAQFDRFTCHLRHSKIKRGRRNDNFSPKKAIKTNNIGNKPMLKINTIVRVSIEDFISFHYYGFVTNKYSPIISPFKLKNQNFTKYGRINIDKSSNSFLEFRIIVTSLIEERCMELFSIKLKLSSKASRNIVINNSMNSINGIIKQKKKKKSIYWSPVLKGKYLSSLIENFVAEKILKIPDIKNNLDIIKITYIYGNTFYFNKQLQTSEIKTKITTRSFPIPQENKLLVQLNNFLCGNTINLTLSECISLQRPEKKCMAYNLKKYQNKDDLIKCQNNGQKINNISEENNSTKVYCKCLSGYFGNNCQYFNNCYHIKNDNTCYNINQYERNESVLFNKCENIFKCNFNSKMAAWNISTCNDKVLTSFNQFFDSEQCIYNRGYINCNCDKISDFTKKINLKYYMISIVCILILFILMLMASIIGIKLKSFFPVLISDKKNTFKESEKKFTIDDKNEDNYSQIIRTCDSDKNLNKESIEVNKLLSKGHEEFNDFNYSSIIILPKITKSTKNEPLNIEENYDNIIPTIFHIFEDDSSDFIESCDKDLYENPNKNYDNDDLPKNNMYIINKRIDDSNLSNSNENSEYDDFKNYMHSINNQTSNFYDSNLYNSNENSEYDDFKNYMQSINNQTSNFYDIMK